jgi:hypothetical protein
MSFGGNMQNLGGAQYTITVNTAQFQQGLQQAQGQAQASSQVIVASLGNLQIIPRQLSAINQSIMATTGAVYASAQQTTAAIQAMTAQLATFQRTASATTFGRGYGGLGMQMMIVAQLADDVQYGFKAIVNQIPMAGMALGQALGMGAQEAMVFGAQLGVAAVVVNQLIDHWGQLTNILQSAWSGAPYDQLEKLRLKAEEATKAFEKLSETPTRLEAKQASGVSNLISEAPAGNVLKGVFEAVMQDPALRPQEIDEETRRDNSKLTVAILEDRRRDEARKKAAEMVGAASLPGEKGDQARATIADLAKRFPGAFPKDFATNLAEQSPEALKRQQDFEKQAEIRKQVEANIQRDIEKRNKEAEDQAKRRGQVVKEAEEKEAKGRKQFQIDQKKLIHDNLREEMWKLQDQKDRTQERLHVLERQAKGNMPFTGDYFDFVKRATQETPAEQKQLQKLDAIKEATRAVEKAIREKQRDVARAG